MSIAKVLKKDGITLYCADRHSIFRPYPAKDPLLKGAVSGVFTLQAGKIGITAFQIILESETDVTVTAICGSNMTCINTEGVDIAGRNFCKTVDVQANRPWPLWCLLDTPTEKKLEICVELQDGRRFPFAVSLEISDKFNSSLFDAETLARLQWLNSREGTENTLIQGYAPVTAEGKTFKILGRTIRISECGFIDSIGTHFVGNNSKLSDVPREILAAPLEYAVYEDGKKLEFAPMGLAVTCKGETCCEWQAENVCGDLKLTVRGAVEFDGAVQYNAQLENSRGRKLFVRLIYAPRPEFAKYFMGLGQIGGKTPEKFIWKWDANKRQEAFWCGSMNGGVRIHPTAPNLERPLVNIYFHHSRNYMPENWVGGGKGYFALENGSMYYDSGEFAADQIFCADLMISPFKLVDMNAHWNTHYYHKNFNTPYTQEDVSDALAAGCSHINVHHGNDTIPYLNYPMHDLPAVKELADFAHANGLGLKPYYTVRELTTRLPELFALRSLGTEIFPLPTYAQGGVPFHNGVDPFLTENFGDEVIPAWKHTFVGGKYDGTTDPTVATNPAGRICNFYVGSLAWLVENAGIDGLYIDDVAFDRQVMRRVRRVFDKRRPTAKIDFHTCNHFEDSPAIGFGYGHNMLIYMELLPYLDSLWVGECYNYSNSTPEYILTEISGLPFGLMSEMLEGDCNVWRGMLYGMTSRYPYYKCYTGPNPVPVWRMRKDFDSAKMIGFWEDNQPIKADRDDVLCTVYHDQAHDRYLCCIANFAEEEVSFRLCGDVLQGKRIFAPEMVDIQSAQDIAVAQTITLPPKGGIMLIVE